MINDLAVVLQSDDSARADLLAAFPESEYDVPPREAVIRTEQARPPRGELNLRTGRRVDDTHFFDPNRMITKCGDEPPEVQRRAGVEEDSGFGDEVEIIAILCLRRADRNPALTLALRPRKYLKFCIQEPIPSGNKKPPTTPHSHMANDIFEQVTIAIGAHRQWKHRLQSAIETGRSSFVPIEISQDNRCDFGRWLHGLPLGIRSTSNWKEVQRLHAAFHQEAGRVLNLALQGDQAGACKCMAFGGTYAAASAVLTAAMIKWKSAKAA